MTQFDAITMRDHAFDQRERLARQVFDVPTVCERIKQAATAGRTDLRIMQDNAVDLSVTRAALKLTAWLQKRGFVVQWKAVERHERIKGRPTELTLKYAELVIDWSGIQSLGGFLSRAAELGLTANITPDGEKKSEPALARPLSQSNT